MVNGLPPYERSIGMVFQNYALWPHMTVADNVAYGLRLRKLPAAEIAGAARGGAAQGQPRRASRRAIPGQLSGGQQQRVALARALVLNPDILLLDEPLSNLDAKIRVQVRAEIRKLQQELGITTIYVTHDQEEALSLSDRVAVMHDGRVLQVGPPKELYERPRTRFVADFVGTNNLVPGEVQASGGRGGDLVVSTALGPLRAVGQRRGVGGAACSRSGPRTSRWARRPRARATGCEGRISFVVLSRQHAALRRARPSAGLVLKADIRDPWHHEPLPVGRPVTLSFPPR